MNPDPLRQYLDAAYRLAQALTLDPAAATTLTEEAFRAASLEHPETWPAEEIRDRILRHVLSAHLRRSKTPEMPESASDVYNLFQAGVDYRGHVALESVDRLLPTALAFLPDRVRTILLLVESESLSVLDAARILSSEPEAVANEYAEALDSLKQALFRGANEVEREILGTGLQGDWLRHALARYVRARTVPTPPTIEVASSHEPHPVPRSAPPRARRPTRILVGLLFILAAGLFGYLASSVLDHEPNRNIVQLSARRSLPAEVEFPTAIPAEAEEYVLDQTGRRLSVPRIQDATLTGASMAEVAEGVYIPLLIFRDRGDGEEIAIYSYSYALLDQHAGQVTLERDVIQQIETEDHFDLHDLGESRVLIWRQRDDIFVAVTRGDAEELKDRIQNGA